MHTSKTLTILFLMITLKTIHSLTKNFALKELKKGRLQLMPTRRKEKKDLIIYLNVLNAAQPQLQQVREDSVLSQVFWVLAVQLIDVVNVVISGNLDK